MNRLPSWLGSRSTLLNWIGGTLVAFGTVWLLLLVREYPINVFTTADLAPSGEASFWTDETLAGVIVSTIAIAIGGVFLLFGCTRLSFLGHHHRRRHRSHHGKSMATVPPSASKSGPDAAIADDDEEVSFDGDNSRGENLLPPDTPGAPTPHGKVKVRVKRRIKMRIRKPNE